MYDALLYLLLALSAAAPDTLVVCPNEFRAALAPWMEHRRRQGHQIQVVPTAQTPEQQKAMIDNVAGSGRLKYLLLIGDVPRGDAAPMARHTVPTYYTPAKVNTRWGSELTIATDSPYADIDGDGAPDLAVGRIPADNAEELSAVVAKIIRYESAPGRAADQRLHIVSGAGGFGTLTDALIEAAARQVIQQAVPSSYLVQQTSANPASPHCPFPGELRACVCRQLSEGGLAWIYLGHGLPTQLDCIKTATGNDSILSVDDVPHLRCGARSPLAVLIACYTGAVDADRDCLAEELLLAERGPVAVIAATRVTMPYGNTVMGYELLRACFGDRPADLGSVVRLAQNRTLGNAAADSLRPSLDMLAVGLSPPPVDLVAERREHVAMYHLFGDPLLRMRYATEEVVSLATPNGHEAGR